MTARKTAFITALFSAIVAVCVLFLFEISVDLQFALPGEVSLPDSEQEARYDQCYAEKDAEIHRIAFGTIDNPDVQKEFISANRAIASNECRSRYPRIMEKVRTPFEFSLIDLTPRFW